MNYVVGFLFSQPSGEHCVLIMKNKPVWQKGKLNGVGGKIEEGETPLQAMVREFEEETGVKTKETDWLQFCTLKGNFGAVVCFRGYKNVNTRSMTDEKVDQYYVKGNALDDLPLIPNLRWLIPMADYRESIIATVEYHSPIVV